MMPVRSNWKGDSEGENWEETLSGNYKNCTTTIPK